MEEILHHRWFIPLFTGFLPSQVVQDFFHPQYMKHFWGDGLKPPSSKQGLFWGTPFSDKAIG